MKLDYTFNIGPLIYIYIYISTYINHNDFLYMAVRCEYRAALI